jgi:hypothetical protein
LYRKKNAFRGTFLSLHALSKEFTVNHKLNINIVAYSLKAKTVESQQPAVTKQRPVNNNRGMFLARSMPMATHATMECVVPPLSSNCTATEEWCFLCGPSRDVISRTVSEELASQSVEWSQLVGERVS